METPYKTVCDTCGKKTWYESEQRCHVTIWNNGNCSRCTGTLRIIDYSDLNSEFTPYYNNGKRIEVDFGYEIKRGTVGITTGWKPSYILLLRKDSWYSPYLIGKDAKVLRIIKTRR